MSVSDGGIAINGIDRADLTPPSQKVPSQKSSQQFRGCPQVRINHGVLNLDWENRHLRIPFDLTARLASTGEIDAMLALYPCGQKMLVSGRWSQQDASGHVSLTAHSLSVEKMAALLKAVPGLAMGGDVDLQAGAAIQMSPFTIQRSFNALELGIFQCRIWRSYIGCGAQDAINTTTPFHLQLLQTGPQRFTVKGGNLMVQSRVPLVLDDLEGDFTYES